jgi:hypothetical protein
VNIEPPWGSGKEFPMLFDRASQVTDNFPTRKAAPASATFPLAFFLNGCTAIFNFSPNDLIVNAGGR